MACDCGCNVQVNLCGVPYTLTPDDDELTLILNLSPVVVDYDPEPIPATAEQTVNETTGEVEAVKLARNAAGAITHIAVCGTWVPLAGGVTVASELVTYDLSTWSFPVDYAAGHGEFTFQSVDRMLTDTCPESTVELVVAGATRANSFGPVVGTPVPAPMLPQTWSAYATANGLTGQILAEPVPAGLQRDAVRLPFDWSALAGASFPTAPLIFSFDYQVAGGNVGVGAWDPTSDTWLPLLGFSAPTGAVVVDRGDHLQLIGGSGSPVGNYQFWVDPTLVADRADIEMVFWAVNHDGAAETFGAFEAIVQAADVDACFTWANPAAVAAYLSAKNGNGNTFVAVGNTVQANVAIGDGTDYGDLAGDGTATITPTVT